MKIELYSANKIVKLFLEVTKRFNIFFYFDYNIETVMWKFGADFIFLDDLVSFSLSFLNIGIVFGYDRDLHIYDGCNACDDKCKDKKDCE